MDQWCYPCISECHFFGCICPLEIAALSVGVSSPKRPRLRDSTKVSALGRCRTYCLTTKEELLVFHTCLNTTVHLFKTFHTTCFTNTNLGSPVLICCELHYSHQKSSYFTHFPNYWLLILISIAYAATQHDNNGGQCAVNTKSETSWTKHIKYSFSTVWHQLCYICHVQYVVLNILYIVYQTTWHFYVSVYLWQ